MILYQCDFCNKRKGCGQITIDGRQYDVCSTCKEEMDKKLKGKGRAAISLGWPYYYNYPYHPYYYGPITNTVPVPTFYTITCGNVAENPQVNSGDGCQFGYTSGAVTTSNYSLQLSSGG